MLPNVKTITSNDCNITIIYNIHTISTQWEFLLDSIPKLSKKGYDAFVVESPYSETFSSELKGKEYINNKGWTIDRYAKHINAEFLETALRFQDFTNTIKNFDSSGFLGLIDSFKGIGVQGHLALCQKEIKIHNLKLSHFKSCTTDIKEQEEIVNLMADTINKYLNRESLQNIFYSSVKLTALINDFKLYGMDVKNDNQCSQENIICRDKFMANKLLERCGDNKMILATVGASHVGMGDIIRASSKKSVDLKEFFPTDYNAPATSPIAEVLLNGRYENVTIIDINVTT